MKNIIPLTSEDVDLTVEAVRKYAAEMAYSFNEPYVRENLYAMANGKVPIMIIKDDNGQIAGVSGMIITPNLYNPEVYEAREFCWHTDPDHAPPVRARLMLRLLDLMVSGCRACGFPLNIAVRAGNRTTAKMLETRGFKLTELIYKKEFF
jgi:hypothetical protein